MAKVGKWWIGRLKLFECELEGLGDERIVRRERFEKSLILWCGSMADGTNGGDTDERVLLRRAGDGSEGFTIIRQVALGNDSNGGHAGGNMGSIGFLRGRNDSIDEMVDFLIRDRRGRIAIAQLVQTENGLGGSFGAFSEQCA